MLGRLVTIAVILAAAYWYWSGPYQQRVNPSYEQRLESNNRNMRECIHGLNYQSGATGTAIGDPEEICAEKFNLYRHKGQWHSYADTRPGE